MKLLLFYSCLLAILFQAVSASLSLDGSGATLTSDKPGSKKAKKPADKSGKKKKRLGGKKAAKKPTKIVDGESGKGVGTKSTKQKKSLRAKKRVVGKKLPKEEGVGKGSKDSVAVKKDEPRYLGEMVLPKVLMEIVIDYVKSDTYYSSLGSTHNWQFEIARAIAVDSFRLYVITYSEGIKSLDHSSAGLKENHRRPGEFGDPEWFDYEWFRSSNDGHSVTFSHKHKTSTDWVAKWLTHDNERENEKPKCVTFDGERFPGGQLSRNGKTLVSYTGGRANVTRVYQIKEEAGKNPTASLKLELNGGHEAVSGDGTRVMVAYHRQLEIHNVGKDASELVCQVNTLGHTCALNESGSEAAFVNVDGILQVIAVDKVVGNNASQSAIVSANDTKGLGTIAKLVYSAKNILHVLHHDGTVSLFDPLTKTLIPIETPQKGQRIVTAAISPNGDFYATIERVGEEEKSSGKSTFRTTVKQREFTADEFWNLFRD